MRQVAVLVRPRDPLLQVPRNLSYFPYHIPLSLQPEIVESAYPKDAPGLSANLFSSTSLKNIVMFFTPSLAPPLYVHLLSSIDGQFLLHINVLPCSNMKLMDTWHCAIQPMPSFLPPPRISFSPCSPVRESSPRASLITFC